MKITSIKLKNFKRFTDLEIHSIPETAKIILVVGPNGCGKSSLFEAFLHWYKLNVGFGLQNDEKYLRKEVELEFGFHNAVTIGTAENIKPKKGDLYIRSAYRNDSDFTVSHLSVPTALVDLAPLTKIIENDQTVGSNYQRLIYDTLSSMYDTKNDQKSVLQLRNELVGDIQRSISKVFDDLKLDNINNPIGSGSFYFTKGTAKSYHYKNLSGGEKAAFDLILDMHIKKQVFQNSVFCIDEIETHLHTKVQGRLLKELYDILPNGSQLWITTHSLGVLRAAQQIEHDHAGSVCLIDFDIIDPDVPREITPSNLDRTSWEKMLSIALDDLSLRVAPKVVIMCEGSAVGHRRKDFDAEIYNRIIGNRYPDLVFVSGGSSNQIAINGISFRNTLQSVLGSSKVISLRDRDDMSDDEIKHFERTGDLVLPERNLESILFGDDVLEKLVHTKNNSVLVDEALRIKREAILRSIDRQNAPDDLKSAAGEIFNNLKALLTLTKCGNDKDAFMRDTLAPLVTEGMPSYNTLRSGIIDKVKHLF